MSTNKSVFIVGPGFIGWHVVDNLVAEDYQVTGLVRRESHAAGIKASGASTVLGDLNDHDLIKAQTLQHDIIIHTATADHLPSVQAILDGIQERADQGRPTIFIHTSGTSVLDDNSNGAFKSDKIYSDQTRSQVDSVPDSAPHREIDLAIVRAQAKLGDRAKLAIMVPPLIYGYSSKHQRLTIQIPTLTRFALKHGFAPYVGEGKAVESNIHVADLGRAYTYVLHHLEQTPAASTLENPYFFCETTGNNEPSWKDVASTIGEALHAAGRIPTARPKTLPKELQEDLFGDLTGPIVGLNSRSRAHRLRALGWAPRERDWKRSFIEDELPILLKEDASAFNGYVGTKPQ